MCASSRQSHQVAVKKTSRLGGTLSRQVAGMPERATRPKIQDVAHAAGVSLGTISAVLNGKGRVSERTRDRVKVAIEQLRYRPDLYASNLARRQTQLLGLIVSNLQNPFFAETAQAIEEAAAQRGYQVSLMATNFSPDQHRAAVRQLLGARLAGLAVITSEHDAIAHDLVQASGVPSVFLDVGKPAGNSSVIRVDSRGGMKAAVEHLIELGHRELLFVRSSPRGHGRPLFSHRLRHQGFQAAVRACGVHDLVTRVVDVEGAGAEAGERAIASLDHSTSFTAVVAVTDMIAMGVYRGLQARGVRIPRDVSVVGFDNTEFSRFLTPPLTTVDVSRTELSRLTVEALLKPGQDANHLLHLPTRLVVRDSTATPGRNARSRVARGPKRDAVERN